MIIRTWHGWTTPENADRYQQLLEDEVIPGIAARAITGVAGPAVLRHDGPDEVTFTTMMSFADSAGVDAFGGIDGAAVVPPAARDLLSRFDLYSTHEDLVLGDLEVAAPPPD